MCGLGQTLTYFGQIREYFQGATPSASDDEGPDGAVPVGLVYAGVGFFAVRVGPLSIPLMSRAEAFAFSKEPSTIK